MLSKKLNAVFIEGDDYHSPENVQKMSVLMQPLNDEDREPWLQSLYRVASSKPEDFVVMACSALKHKYRLLLSGAIQNLGDDAQPVHYQQQETMFVYLKGSKELIKERMKKRHKHYMKIALLDSQFDALEEPSPCKFYKSLTVEMKEGKTPETIVEEIFAKLN